MKHNNPLLIAAALALASTAAYASPGSLFPSRTSVGGGMFMGSAESSADRATSLLPGEGQAGDATGAEAHFYRRDFAMLGNDWVLSGGAGALYQFGDLPAGEGLDASGDLGYIHGVLQADDGAFTVSISPSLTDMGATTPSMTVDYPHPWWMPGTVYYSQAENDEDHADGGLGFAASANIALGAPGPAPTIVLHPFVRQAGWRVAADGADFRAPVALGIVARGDTEAGFGAVRLAFVAPEVSGYWHPSAGVDLGVGYESGRGTLRIDYLSGMRPESGGGGLGGYLPAIVVAGPADPSASPLDGYMPGLHVRVGYRLKGGYTISASLAVAHTNSMPSGGAPAGTGVGIVTAQQTQVGVDVSRTF